MANWKSVQNLVEWLERPDLSTYICSTATTMSAAHYTRISPHPIIKKWKADYYTFEKRFCVIITAKLYALVDRVRRIDTNLTSWLWSFKLKQINWCLEVCCFSISHDRFMNFGSEPILDKEKINNNHLIIINFTLLSKFTGYYWKWKQSGFTLL